MSSIFDSTKNGSVGGFNIVRTNVNYDANSLDLIETDVTAGPITITAPASGMFTVVDIVKLAGTNNITISRTAGIMIGGVDSDYVLNKLGSNFFFVYDETNQNWFVQDNSEQITDFVSQEYTGVAVAGQTVITPGFTWKTAFTGKALFISGVKQAPNSYTVNSIGGGLSSQITLSEALVGGETIDFTALDVSSVPSLQGIVDTLALQPTQITNAGMGVWSNGTLVSVGSSITVTNITSGVCATTNTQGIAVGRLVYFASGSNAAVASKLFEVTAVTTNTNFTINDTAVSPGAVTSTTANEYTVGCVAADTKGPDGWTKDTGVQCWRDQINTKSGSYYALRVYNGSVYWSDGSRTSKPEFYSRYAGRSVALGMWVRCSSANKARIGITDSAGTTWSNYHSGGGSYEWLEVTRTPGTGITYFYVAMDSGTGTEAQFSQPQLMFGTSVGAGNFVPIPNEYIPFETPITSTSLVKTYTTGSFTFSPSVDSKGAVPRGAKKYSMYATAVDTANGTYYFFTSGVLANYDAMIGLFTSGVTVRLSGSVNIPPIGVCVGTAYASGTNTLTVDAYNYTGVQL